MSGIILRPRPPRMNADRGPPLSVLYIVSFKSVYNSWASTLQATVQVTVEVAIACVLCQIVMWSASRSENDVGPYHPANLNQKRFWMIAHVSNYALLVAEHPSCRSGLHQTCTGCDMAHCQAVVRVL